MYFSRSARAAPAAASVALLASAFLPFTNAQGYAIGTTEEIKESAAQLAADLMLFYPGREEGRTLGILPGPPSENKGDYYWWQGGAMWGAYMDYWHLTGDSTYNDIVMEAMQHQVGENNDYQPRNFTASLGNDDQGFWGMSAILAAENKFPNPPEDRPQWLALAQAVWNTQNHPDRHDEFCNGGMRWQVPPLNIGYNYKNTIANACFFNIGARLARYTGNTTYARIAEETWDWVYAVNYIDHETWLVYDGGHVEHNCTDVNKLTFSYNPGIFIQGAAHLWNMTEDQKWADRIDNLLDSFISRFFFDDVIFEWQCEAEPGHCSADMLMFKGFVIRWLGQVSQLAPWTAEKILPILRTTTEAAVRQCTGGATGRVCGFYWTTGAFVDPAVDLTSGAGEALNVLSAVSTLLVADAEGPASAENGGISEGDVNAGPKDGLSEAPDHAPITSADRAGAIILTILIVSGAIGTFVWMTYFD
jgi:mannan endo-1,6-alpha-mannosidase